MSFYDNDYRLTLSPSVWSQLPMELMREILLFAASNSAHNARTLRLVSRYTNIWILPLLFHNLVLTTPEHITRFATTLLPKRRLHIPALKSTLHTLPRPLASYAVHSLALAVNSRLPSLETALASVAPALTHLAALATTPQNLSAHAHWLRRHPVRPSRVLLLHFGRPRPVDFREPLFAHTTHLYTSVLEGLRGSSVIHLPHLTHLAVHARIGSPERDAARVAVLLRAALDGLPGLYACVLVLDSEEVRDYRLEMWDRVLSREGCTGDSRFILLPVFRHPRAEWGALVKSAGETRVETGDWEPELGGYDAHTVWDRAQIWRAVGEAGGEAAQAFYWGEALRAVATERAGMPGRRYGEAEWEVDVVEREGVFVGDVDPAERLYRRTPYPRNLDYHT